jgi:hypothetical protein
MPGRILGHFSPKYCGIFLAHPPMDPPSKSPLELHQRILLVTECRGLREL